MGTDAHTPDLAVRPDDPVLDGHRAVPIGVVGALGGRHVEVPVVGMRPLDGFRQPGGNVVADPGDVPKAVRPVVPLGAVIVFEEAQPHHRDGLVQALFTVEQQGLRLLAKRDVERDGKHGGDLAGFVTQRRSMRLQPPACSATSHDLELQGSGLPVEDVPGQAGKIHRRATRARHPSQSGRPIRCASHRGAHSQATPPFLLRI